MEKYVVNYTIDKDVVHVYNNLGQKRTVRKNRKNLKKIDQAIVENKVRIAKRINEYESRAKERSIVFALNILATLTSGGCVVLSFFTGYLPFLYCSLCVLSLTLIPTLTKAFAYSIDVKEISELKRITGYRLDMEFTLPKLKKEKTNV